jgi:Domain of unknown function (DUF4304)
MPRRELRAGLKDALNLLLQQHGFTAHGFSWSRETAGFVDVVDVQWGKVDTQEDYRFTLNAGVCWLKAYELTWEKAPPAKMSTPECTVQERVGFIASDRDKWWLSTEQSDAAMIAEAREMVSAVLLPFLDGLHSPTALESLLSARKRVADPVSAIARALLLYERGDVAGARGVLEDRLAKPGNAWTPRYRAVLARLN